MPGNRIHLIIAIGWPLLFLVGCGDPRVDASTDEKMKDSLAKVKASIPDDKRTEFEEALRALAFADISDLGDLAAAGQTGGLERAIKDRVDGKTGLEIIAEGKRVKADKEARRKAREAEQEAVRKRFEEERKAREREQALKEIEELRTKMEGEGADLLSAFMVERSSFGKSDDGFIRENAIELAVKNETGTAVSRAYFHAILHTPGREIPWVDSEFNQTDDGEDYTYVYDAFGRLRQVKDRSDSSLVAEYRYNGLGFRIGWHYDADIDSDVDSSDPWFYFCYDDAWRIVATFRADDADPKEVFVHHNAGPGGYGDSSYIDSLILRDRDTSTKWYQAADSARNERRYFCQNWRADVSALLTDDGSMVEWTKYSVYGVPLALPAGDTDSDGDWDATDSAAVTGGGVYDVRKDTDLDGDMDTADAKHAQSITGGYQTLGRGVLSSSAVGNRRGYAGYEYDPTFEGAGRHLYHVRHRVYDADVGRWTKRDPLGYIDGMSLYEYVGSMPKTRVDSTGLCARECAACVVALAGAGISTVGLGACAAPEPTFSKAACAAALAGLGTSVYGAIDSCVACATCVSGGDDSESDPKPDPGRPPTPGEQCVGSSTSGSECARCCSRNYARDTNACFSNPNNDASLCPRWPWWRHSICANNREQNLSNCLNDAGRAYNACWRTCYEEFPPQDRMPWIPPINPEKDLDLPKPDKPPCASATCGGIPGACSSYATATY